MTKKLFKEFIIFLFRNPFIIFLQMRPFLCIISTTKEISRSNRLCVNASKQNPSIDWFTL